MYSNDFLDLLKSDCDMSVIISRSCQYFHGLVYVSMASRKAENASLP
jgi:hypothetical protein